MNTAERVAARFLEAARPGPLLQGVQRILPVWAKHLSDKTDHTFDVGRPKPIKQRGRSGFRVILESQYSPDDSLIAVFTLQKDGGLDLTVKHRNNTHAYTDVRPNKLPEDQLIRDLKIELGPETLVWSGVGATETVVTGLSQKVVRDMLEGIAEGVIDDRFSEVMGSEAEMQELLGSEEEPFENFWDLWYEQDERVRGFVRERLEATVSADRPDKTTLVEAVEPERVKEAIGRIRMMGYYTYG